MRDDDIKPRVRVLQPMLLARRAVNVEDLFLLDGRVAATPTAFNILFSRARVIFARIDITREPYIGAREAAGGDTAGTATAYVYGGRASCSFLASATRPLYGRRRLR